MSAQTDKAMEFQTRAVVVASMLEELRESGWRVARHNDYMQNGKLHTFWLFTYGVWCAKGEAENDYDALRIVRSVIANVISTGGL